MAPQLLAGGSCHHARQATSEPSSKSVTVAEAVTLVAVRAVVVGGGRPAGRGVDRQLFDGAEGVAAGGQELQPVGRVGMLTAGLTTLLISHRFSTVRMADTVAVIEDGRVVETGGHDDLVAAAGRYAELYALQAGRFK